MKQTISLFPITRSITKIVNNRRICQQIHDDENGFHHRVCWRGHCSDWTGYAFIAVLAVDGHRFCSTTYYYDGVLPELFEVLT